jgi:F420-0:gamma-glutamyl ligase
MLLFCQKETGALADALRAYLAAATSVLRVMIARAEQQAWKLGAKGGVASSAAGLKVIKDWQERIKDERDFRMAMIRELETLATRLDGCSP